MDELDDRDLRDARRKTYDADAKGYTAFALDAFKDNHFGKYVKPLMDKYLSSIGLDYGKYKNLSETEKRKIDEGWRNSDFYKEAQNPVYEKRASAEYVAEQYHKAKADGSNPELVKAVEDLLGKPKAITPNVEDWSKDVDSTTKALEELMKGRKDDSNINLTPSK